MPKAMRLPSEDKLKLADTTSPSRESRESFRVAGSKRARYRDSFSVMAIKTCLPSGSQWYPDTVNGIFSVRLAGVALRPSQT